MRRSLSERKREVIQSKLLKAQQGMLDAYYGLGSDWGVTVASVNSAIRATSRSAAILKDVHKRLAKLRKKVKSS